MSEVLLVNKDNIASHGNETVMKYLQVIDISGSCMKLLLLLLLSQLVNAVSLVDLVI
jgi:hypothetical protein